MEIKITASQLEECFANALHNIETDCGGTLAEIIEKAHQYRWHNLRKNPDDLPTHSNIVEVELWGEVLGTYYDHTWFKDGNWKHYANNSYGKVIGWREIEPMEGETE